SRGDATASATSTSSTSHCSANAANAPGAATVSTVDIRKGPPSSGLARVSTMRRKLCIDDGVVSTIQRRLKGHDREVTWSFTACDASLTMTTTSLGQISASENKTRSTNVWPPTGTS